MKTIPMIHVAIKQLELDDDVARDAYERATGKRSLKAMSQAEREKVVNELVRMGFKKGPPRTGRHRPASKKGYVRLVYALWRQLGDLGALRDPSREGLRKFVEGKSGIGDPEWLDFAKASPVIQALQSMVRKAGGDPESRPAKAAKGGGR